jgi:hypothetical protein
MAICHRRLAADSLEDTPLTKLFAAAGHRVSETQDSRLDLSGLDVVLMHGNANWYPKVVQALRRRPAGELPLFVLWHAEPLPPPRAAHLPRPRLHLREIAKIALRDSRATDVYTNARLLRNLARAGLPELLLVTTPGRQEYLAEQGIASDFVPYGYHPDWHGAPLDLTRDIDTLFLGALNVPRRKRLMRRLRQRGVALQAMGNWSDPNCFGENRRKLLNRTKILLNLQRYPGELSGLRLILGMANGALVVSEPIYRTGPYVAGEHFVSATIEEMPDVVRHYLTHEDERARIALAGQRLVLEDLTLERVVAQMADHIAHRLANRS